MDKRLEYLYANFYNLTNQEYQYIGLLIDNIIQTDRKISEIESRLIFKYAVREKCLANGYPVVKVQYRQIEGKNANKKANYSFIKNIITVNTRLYNFVSIDGLPNGYPHYGEIKNELAHYLKIAFHECEHYFQYSDLMKGILNKNSFAIVLRRIFSKYIKPKNGENEYNLNYNFKESEMYANKKGWYETIMFLSVRGCKKEIIDEISNVWLQTGARINLAIQKDHNYNSVIIEKYNIEELTRIVEEHSEVLEEYPLLKKFYFGKEYGPHYGKIKSLEKLINDYRTVENHYYNGKFRHEVEEEKYVYRQFLYYIFSQNKDLIEIKYKDILNDLIINDLISLQGVFDFQNKDVNEYRKVVSEKINRVIDFSICYNKNSDEENCCLMSTISETLKVYETSKLMYGDKDDVVEAKIEKLREKFNIYDVEYRNPQGRKSAINI